MTERIVAPRLSHGRHKGTTTRNSVAKSSRDRQCLRHAYDHVAPDVLWKLAQDDLAEIEKACREELVLAEGAGAALKFNRSSLQSRQCSRGSAWRWCSVSFPRAGDIRRLGGRRSRRRGWVCLGRF